MVPVATVVIVSACTVLPFARPAGAATGLTSDRAQATQIEQEISSTGQEISALGQKFEADQEHKAALDAQIAATEAQITRARQKVASDKAVLRKAAVNAYLSSGTPSSGDSLFAGSQTSAAAVSEYSGVAEGDIGTAVANLDTARNTLAVQVSSLRTQDAQAAQAEASAQAAEQQAKILEAQQTQALSQVKGKIATLVAQQQKAAAAAAQAAAEAKIQAAQAAAAAQAQAQAQAQALAATTTQAASQPSAGGNALTVSASPPPPPSAGGAGAAAVAAAESQLGVPYRWAAETPKGTPDPGFDCSGLTAWAWGQAGVPLPHYSGSQMADSTPVPITDLQPGDLLFYGPGGDTHVAMYIGGGQMIQAPETGQTVSITGIELTSGWFAGAGRP